MTSEPLPAHCTVPLVSNLFHSLPELATPAIPQIAIKFGIEAVVMHDLFNPQKRLEYCPNQLPALYLAGCCCPTVEIQHTNKYPL